MRSSGIPCFRVPPANPSLPRVSAIPPFAWPPSLCTVESRSFPSSSRRGVLKTPLGHPRSFFSSVEPPESFPRAEARRGLSPPCAPFWPKHSVFEYHPLSLIPPCRRFPPRSSPPRTPEENSPLPSPHTPLRPSSLPRQSFISSPCFGDLSSFGCSAAFSIFPVFRLIFLFFFFFGVGWFGFFFFFFLGCVFFMQWPSRLFRRFFFR